MGQVTGLRSRSLKYHPRVFISVYILKGERKVKCATLAHTKHTLLSEFVCKMFNGFCARVEHVLAL